jgi:RHS repeat-associated protein
MAAICDVGGNVQERYAFTAYGVCQFLNASFGTISHSVYDWTVLYTGREFDPATALNYLRGRHLSSAVGIFASRDPVQFDLNPYRYVGNNPCVYIDPFGLASIWTFSGINNYEAATATDPGHFTSYVGIAVADYLSQNNINPAIGNEYVSHIALFQPGVPRDRNLVDVLSRPILPRGKLDADANALVHGLDTSTKPEYLANKVRRPGPAGSCLPGAFCNKTPPTKIKILMMAPKVNKKPNVNKRCCNIDTEIFWSPHDPVPNQGVGPRIRFGKEDYPHWVRWAADFGGRVVVHTVDPSPGNAMPHDFGRFWASQNQMVQWVGVVNGGWKSIGLDPSQPKSLVKAWANDKSVDYIFVCHSQGCNILREAINCLCK